MAGHKIMMVLIVLAGCFIGLAWTVRQRYNADARRTVVRRAVAESIGICALALTCEGSATRYPIEGVAGCLGDIPGGYCCRGMCDVVACPGLSGRPLTLEIVRTDR